MTPEQRAAAREICNQADDTGFVQGYANTALPVALDALDEADKRIAALEATLYLIRLNMRGDVFVDPVKRGIYMRVLDAALEAR